jgi:D-alanyl-D-alanine carboxypeptidase
MRSGRNNGVFLIGLGMMAMRLAGAALVLLLVPGAPSRAETRHAAMIVDANTGSVLYEQFADAPRHPASLTKMMTLYLVFEEIEQGRLSYTTKITVSAKAASVAPSKLELEPGEEIDLIDAIKALITKSANDMAVALAEHIGGSEAGFVRMMNERAHQIGMRSTTFTNASGLPDDRQITTARDMVTLALHLQDDFPRHYPLFSMKSFEFRGKTYRTHNTLLYGFPGMDGIKTGYTRASGFNLISSVKVDNKHLVGAVFGGVTASARNAHMRLQLYRALEKASSQRTRRPAPKLVARAAPAKRPAADDTKSDWTAETSKTAARSPAAAPPKPQPTSQEPSPSPAGAPGSGPKTGEPQIASPTGAPPDIAVLKVRPVAIAVPRSPAPAQPETPPSAPADAPAAAAPSVTPKLDLQALRAAISSEAFAGAASDSAPAPAAPPPSSIEDIISSSAPSPVGQRFAQAGDGSSATSTSPSMGLGRQPSTLDAQAAAIGPALQSRAPPTLKPATHDQPVRFAAAPVGSGYEIQIGAYSTAEEAENRMAAARSRATGLLEGHRSMALPVRKAERQIFRARFTGFNEDAAGSACLDLRRLAIDCFVMKSE